MAVGGPSPRDFNRQYDWMYTDVTFLNLKFPVEIEDFGERLRYITEMSTEFSKYYSPPFSFGLLIQKTNERLKKSWAPGILMVIQAISARLGGDAMVSGNISEIFMRHSFVFSNVPAWPKPIYFCGRKMIKAEASYFNVVPQCIVLTYGGEINCTLVTLFSARLAHDGPKTKK